MCGITGLFDTRGGRDLAETHRDAGRTVPDVAGQLVQGVQVRGGSQLRVGGAGLTQTPANPLDLRVRTTHGPDRLT